MPPKKQVTREDILAGALTLFREQGMEAINARELARVLGCSTQPIYLSFSGMEELKNALVEEFWRLYGDFLHREMERGDMPVYKASGMGYIRFAKQEREIFRYLFMRPRTPQEQNGDGMGQAHFDAIIALVRRQLGLSEQDARRFHLEQWLFVHGIATMFATSYLDLEESDISEMLTDNYRGLRKQFLSKGEGNV